MACTPKQENDFLHSYNNKLSSFVCTRMYTIYSPSESQKVATTCIKPCTMWLFHMGDMGSPEDHPVLGSDERSLFPCHRAERLTAGGHNCCILMRFVMLHMSAGKGSCAPQGYRKETEKRLRFLVIMTPKAAARTFQVGRHADGCPTSHISILYSVKQGRQAALAHQAANNTDFMQVPVCALPSWPLSPRCWLQLLPLSVYQRGTCLPQ